MAPEADTIIVGAGLAGLACAVRLVQGGRRPLLLEAGDAPGGRVRTDVVDGFLLDRGFQVYLSAYPEAGRLLDLEALELKPFLPGARIRKAGRFHTVMDVWRHPVALPGTLAAPVGNLKDKLLVERLRRRLQRSNRDVIWSRPDRPTFEYLRDFGFSEGMIDTFFRPFYGGIFLEHDLVASSRVFEFTFKMFSEGYATLPARGMEALPRQLQERLPEGTIRTGARVARFDPIHRRVVLESGEAFSAKILVFAVEEASLKPLLPLVAADPIPGATVTCIYFAADHSPVRDPIIVLNAEGPGEGPVNNFCVPSDVAPGYAPPGKALISATAIAHRSDGTDFETGVRRQVRSWFGKEVESWDHLKTITIRHPLPAQSPGSLDPQRKSYLVDDGVYVCGDHQHSGSIEGAVISGIRTAVEICGDA